MPQEMHPPTRLFLLWCNVCARMYPPGLDRKQQLAAAEAAGWLFQMAEPYDMCPECRPRREPSGGPCSAEMVRQLEQENEW